MKVLNLDQYAQTNKQVTLKGESHNVEELDVQGFVDNVAAADELDKLIAERGDLPVGAGMDLSIAQVLKAVPTMPKSVVMTLKMSQLAALLQFIRGELDPEKGPAPEAVEGAAEVEGADAKKA